MNYLLTGIILLIIFTIVIILLVSSSYNHLEKQAKLNPDNNTLKTKNDDVIFNYIKHLSQNLQDKLKKGREGVTNKNGILKVLGKISDFLIKCFIIITNFIIGVVEKIKPIKETEIKFNPDEEIEDDKITNDILDTPNVILRENPRRVKSLKQIQNDKQITNEEFEKLESALLYKLERTMGEKKFKVALDLANLYGRVGNKEDQKNLCKWILEKGSDQYQQTASRMLIGL